MTCFTWAKQLCFQPSHELSPSGFWSSPSCLTMNLSEQISHLFSCNVSPSEMPHLDIGVSKRVPLEIAVPVTIFYSCVFICGVWTDALREMTHKGTDYFSPRVRTLLFYRWYSMGSASWPFSLMLTCESVPFASIFSASSYQVHTIMYVRSMSTGRIIDIYLIKQSFIYWN